jgi:hypothetical protein
MQVSVAHVESSAGSVSSSSTGRLRVIEPPSRPDADSEMAPGAIISCGKPGLNRPSEGCLLFCRVPKSNRAAFGAGVFFGGVLNQERELVGVGSVVPLLAR